MATTAFTAIERYRALSVDRVNLGSLAPETQNSDYESAQLEINSQLWHIRTARITPNKPGAFLAFWRRALDGTTEPFSGDDECVGLKVFVSEGDRFGVFSFTREHLLSLRVVSAPGIPGKRGFRVYPSWCEALNPQASRTQRAQAIAFAELIAPTSVV
ncbi:MepB family protein [Leucobacter sp. UT-8R-CII-1-4]|uniref:MepB family protein n=1 Tax=Leucobacter sp. UT-8R-CII-1-4 TaxID=3040075 RepID=UPI0024A9398E|nr:MepB family protein [Leucobacter sp. UT-8R-CII-1-4]MDI6022419.1 MepB family protein [Leucobacter sp. UT-8R-CII-1-4]